MSMPNYADKVMSRFGHHLSPQQRTMFSDAMIPNFHSSSHQQYQANHSLASVIVARDQQQRPGVTINSCLLHADKTDCN
ncbi:hypothetical protein A0J61_08444 [Choanephora cucurbitarum]|uniref:Uncharacterized protein n=1 Tax=Choanephora cucurbitarum TaxID=101091 RepID=A0A1C7N306_9FUNG|nr:hypothetical protein A0J61_08444 [Choanephora cucurbitarum]